MTLLTFYQARTLAPTIRAARPDRAWMDATPERYAYRCLPLSIANSLGWEVLLPCGIEAEWNGGKELEDLQVEIADSGWRDKIASSHFGDGILTFHFGYVTRTEPGTGLLVRGVPNRPKDGIAPLEALVETDWLPFTFTMNWQFTRPGRVAFEKDEPFCFLMPVRPGDLLAYKPEIAPIAANPPLEAEFGSWASQRKEFNQKLLAEEPDAVRQAWQKWYTRGETADGESRGSEHRTRIALAAPVARPSGTEIANDASHSRKTER